MSHLPAYNFLLILPHLLVQNANAISSPLTHGFPSVTAFLGMMWALERKSREQGLDLRFKAVGIVCHNHQEQSTRTGFVGSFSLTRNPIDKDGSTAAIVEEGRIHLELSLVLAVDCPRWVSEPEAKEEDADRIAQILSLMRIAGGTLLPPTHPSSRRYKAYVIDQSGNDDECRRQFHQTRTRLLPGFALVARDDLLESRLADLQAAHPSTTRLDAWLSLARINWRHALEAPTDPGSDTKQTSHAQPHVDTAPKGEWLHDRTGLGWIVPIPVGYGALGDTHQPGEVTNARDMHTPFRFVESLYSIGQWLSPHHLSSAHDLLWYADSQADTGLYRCRNDYSLPPDLLDLQYDFD